MKKEKPKKPTSTKEIQRMDTITLHDEKQTVWSDSLEFRISTIEPPSETPWGGYCQAIDCTLNGDPMTMNYFFGDIEGAIDLNETDSQWYRVKYLFDKDLYKCEPTKARPKENLNAVAGKNVWEEKDLRITKMSCIKSAVAYYSLINAPPTSPVLPSDILGVAERFRKYVYDYKEE